MGNVVLVPISVDDIGILDLTEYKNLTTQQRLQLVSESQAGVCRGVFFRFYLIKSGEKFVGVINMCGHGEGKVSVAPEIFEIFRNQGLATKSLSVAYAIAKDMGFETVIAGIREDNVASQKLHEKFGFECVGNSVSKNGNVLKTYSRRL